MQLRPLLVTLVPLCITACAVAPVHELPASPVPAAWPMGAAYAVAVPSAAEAADIRWQSFILDARLRTVVGLALTNSRSLRETIARIDSARALYGVQRAAMLPSISATLSANGSRSMNSTGSDRNATADSLVYEAELGISAYEIDLFGRVRNLSDAALQTYLASEQAAGTTRISLIAETILAWLTLAADEDRLAISQQALDAARRTMEITGRRLQLGAGTAIDTSLAETLFQQARVDLANTTTQIALDRNTLDLLVGASVATPLLPVAQPELDQAVADVDSGLSSGVLLRRPDVRQAMHELASADANVAAARAAFFPTISLTGSAGVASTALSMLLSGGSSVWSLAPALKLPIFDGGANRHGLAYAQAQRQLAWVGYELVVQNAFTEVADALAQRGTMNEQLAAQQALVAAADRSRLLAEKRHTAGADAFLPVLIARQALYVGQLKLVTTRLAAGSNRVALYKVLGGGFGVRQESVEPDPTSAGR